MLDYYVSISDWVWDSSEQSQYENLRELQDRLLSNNPVVLPQITSNSLKLIKEDIERNLTQNIPELVIDRLHSFSTEFFRNICRKHNIDIYDNRGNTLPLQSLVGKLKNWYIDNNYFESEFAIVAIQNSINTFDRYNLMRNEQSAAHPNELLNKAEAHYAVIIVIETIIFIDKIEDIKDQELKQNELFITRS